MIQPPSDELEVERRQIVRPGWVLRLIWLVRKIGVWRSTVICSALTVIASTALCHILYSIFGVPRVGVALVMPTLAPAIIAPPMIYVQLLAIELLGRAESTLEDQRTRLQSAVDLAQQQALKADMAARAKSEFLAHMSHELRTPLNAILGFSESIRDIRMGPIGTKAYRDYAGHIHESGEHLLSLINDILDMSRIESGRMELKIEMNRALELIQECSAMVEGDAHSRGINLTLSCAPGDLIVFGDRRAIKQIIINLLSNAVKFTPESGQVKIAARYLVSGNTEITVTDDGIGMPKESLQSVFEPFVRLAQTESGTGLGLPLAKGLVDMHGGTLTLDSAPGEGTTARLEFPKLRST